jgi:hypothetical protein
MGQNAWNLVAEFQISDFKFEKGANAHWGTGVD